MEQLSEISVLRLEPAIIRYRRYTSTTHKDDSGSGAIVKMVCNQSTYYKQTSQRLIYTIAKNCCLNSLKKTTKICRYDLSKVLQLNIMVLYSTYINGVHITTRV